MQIPADRGVIGGVSGDDIGRPNRQSGSASTTQRGVIMRIKLGYFTPILGAAVAAIAISAAPLASADTSTPPGTPQQSCSSSGGGTVCQSPGNVQINDAPGPVQFYPYGGEAFLL
jgi:hypothetical protein